MQRRLARMQFAFGGGSDEDLSLFCIGGNLRSKGITRDIEDTAEIDKMAFH